jgi:hypothetical protein
MRFATTMRERFRMFVLRHVLPRWHRLAAPPRLPHGTREKLQVILLSYRRPGNMAAIVDSCLACPFVDGVVLSNNNPSLNIRSFVRHSDSRLSLINQPLRCFPSKRYDLAAEMDAEWFLCIDDDTFLSPHQIALLFLALLKNPAVPHGVAGENFGTDDQAPEYVFALHGRSEKTDCLVWAYAFTRAHVKRYFEILDALCIDNQRLAANEDILLSLSGSGRPLVHNFGTLHLCGSRDTAEVATSMEPGFRQHRVELFRKTSILAVPL